MNQHRPSRPRPNIGPTNDIGPTWPDTIRSFRRGFQALKERAMLGQAQAQHGPNIAPKPLCMFGFYFIFIVLSMSLALSTKRLSSEYTAMLPTGLP